MKHQGSKFSLKKKKKREREIDRGVGIGGFLLLYWNTNLMYQISFSKAP